MRHEPGAGRRGEQKAKGQRARGGENSIHEPAGLIRAHYVQQPGERQHRHDEGDCLVSDRQADAQERACEPAHTRFRKGAEEEEQPGDGAQDLRVVVVDAARLELHDRVAAGEDEHHGDQRGLGARPACDVTRDDQGQREEKQQRPHRADRRLRQLGAKERLQHKDECCQLHVDEARPVRHQRLGCADARERRVEIGASRQQLAHGEKTDRIVRVAQHFRKTGARRHDICEGEQARRASGQDRRTARGAQHGVAPGGAVRGFQLQQRHRAQSLTLCSLLWGSCSGTLRARQLMAGKESAKPRQ